MSSRLMSVVEVEVFEQTSEFWQLRLSVNGGAPRTRGLDIAAVDALVASVERDYGRLLGTQRVFSSQPLTELGSKLFGFLDGDERWLTDTLDNPHGIVLRVTAGQRLRHLPWELLCREGAYLGVSANGPLLPVRAVGAKTAAQTVVAANRPLRVLFMATSPEGVEPVLGFEAEEAAIVAAASRTGVELVVEESGTLEGLRFLCEDYGSGYFDVLHLSGHADVKGGQPVFLAEDEFGGLAAVGADQIARAMFGLWPRMVFMSGCLTGGAPDGGVLPSMSESLVGAGAPAVLGWALPVGDVSATVCAAALYKALGNGQPLDQAVVQARQHLYAERSSSWHLLRVYADPQPLAPMVTHLNEKGRATVHRKAADQDFLDPQTQLSRVASRATFVGRRRVIQRCLRSLQQPANSPDAAQALVLHGMGGLGKSSLASRLLERMPTHQRVVWYGRVDGKELRELVGKIDFPTPDQQIEAGALLSNEQLPLAARLRRLLHADGPLGKTACLFVFDDFEQGNLDPRDGTHVLSADMADILPALLGAIRETGSRSRVIITSRYRFPTPAGTTIKVESLETFTAIEQTKKLANLNNLRPESALDPAIRKRAIHAAAGNPRLLDWLDLIVADTGLDIDGLLAAIENEAARFRENILATQLLSSQDLGLRIMLAKVNVVELPIPEQAVHDIHDHPDTTVHLTRACQLGLVEQGVDPDTRQPRYFVSNVLRPLLRPLLTDEQYTHTCAAAARTLHQLWITGTTPTHASTTQAAS